MLTPCIGLCQLDDDETYCLGCRRTRAEIAHWSRMSPAEQTIIMKDIDETRNQNAS